MGNGSPFCAEIVTIAAPRRRQLRHQWAREFPSQARDVSAELLTNHSITLKLSSAMPPGADLSSRLLHPHQFMGAVAA